MLVFIQQVHGGRLKYIVQLAVIRTVGLFIRRFGFLGLIYMRPFVQMMFVNEILPFLDCGIGCIYGIYFYPLGLPFSFINAIYPRHFYFAVATVRVPKQYE